MVHLKNQRTNGKSRCRPRRDPTFVFIRGSDPYASRDSAVSRYSGSGDKRLIAHRLRRSVAREATPRARVLSVSTREDNVTPPAPRPAKPGRARRSIEKFHVLSHPRAAVRMHMRAACVRNFIRDKCSGEQKCVPPGWALRIFLAPWNYSLQIHIIFGDLNLNLYSYKKPRRRKKQKDELPSVTVWREM